MKTGVWFLLVVLLFNIQLCLSVCEVYVEADNSQNQRCARIKAVLQSALVSSDVNLYVLEEVFRNGQPLTMLEINYIVRLSDSENNHIDYPHHVTWTRSSILASINPKMLLALQPGIVTGLYTFQDIVPRRNITLILTVPAHELPPRQPSRPEEIQHVLESITLKLKQYAAKRMESDESNDGFIAVWSMIDHSKYTVITNVLIATVLLASFSLIIAVTPSLKFFKQEQAHSTDNSAQLFRSLVKVTIFTNILEFVSTMVLLVQELSSPTIDVFYCFTKAGILAAVMTPVAFGTLIGCIKHRYHTNISTHCSKSTLFRLVFCWYGICNYYVFVFLTALNLIPTIVLLFVHPIVITSVAFVCATVFCLTLVLTLPSPCLIILQRFKSSKNACEHNDLKTTKICNASLYLVPSMMIALVMFPVLSSFLTSSEFVHTSQHMICVLLFLPSVMLTIIGMIVFKELIRNSRLLMKATDESNWTV